MNILLDKFSGDYFICTLEKSWPLIKYHIKGERKEADWSVAKNLLKPKDGGKVKVVARSFIFDQNHTLQCPISRCISQPTSHTHRWELEGMQCPM